MILGCFGGLGRGRLSAPGRLNTDGLVGEVQEPCERHALLLASDSGPRYAGDGL